MSQDDKDHPLGTVTTSAGSVFALLGTNRWRVILADGSESPIQAEMLSEVYRDRYRGPQDGFYVPAILEAVAGDYGGTVAVLVKPAFDPDVDY